MQKSSLLLILSTSNAILTGVLMQDSVRIGDIALPMLMQDSVRIGDILITLPLKISNVR